MLNRSDEKPIEEVLVDVIRAVASEFNGPYHVAISSDDGGKYIEVRVEMMDSTAPILKEHPKFPLDYVRTFEGRVVVSKVPPLSRKKSF